MRGLSMAASDDRREVRLAVVLPWLAIAAGLAAMYLPTGLDLARTVWDTDEQGHGPIVLALAVWLFWRKWPEIHVLSVAESRPLLLPGAALAIFSALLYALGRSQQIKMFEVISLIPMLGAILLAMRGPRALLAAWFPLFFLLFMTPLPGAFVDALTQPMKLAVSSAAASLMYAMGYPIARTGVILEIGQYQLLVADACAGLNTLFTLEALGLLYLNVVRTASVVRNIGLAILIVPISFCANVVRVVALSLITYYFGDEAGQGFLHGFAGIVLFLTALTLIIGFDTLLRMGFHRPPRTR